MRWFVYTLFPTIKTGVSIFIELDSLKPDRYLSCKLEMSYTFYRSTRKDQSIEHAQLNLHIRFSENQEKEEQPSTTAFWENK